FISPDAEIGADTVIYGNVRIEGRTVIGVENTITEGTYILNSRIGDFNNIVSSRLLDVTVGDHETIGPWAVLDDTRKSE
ncbi:MAG: bifunctional UDP-N-acetylglucosamine diphosphorylase/glucosamine-1-phosphate N-acetyltransferase GlmU, partial [Erysipelotrichaceae bacterium]|nr:bifunctional UDP-N-acetylglucosamine diphosphorylase/glucosamine-1-phosphate N-acetyltransferase GlmU [Erysipelotrichaceae bacterium]